MKSELLTINDAEVSDHMPVEGTECDDFGSRNVEREFFGRDWVRTGYRTVLTASGIFLSEDPTDPKTVRRIELLRTRGDRRSSKFRSSLKSP